MTDEFLTKGLENDRYPKALRLVDQFEEEIEALLGDFGQRVIDKHPGLFEDTPDPSVRSNHDSSSALAIHRLNYSMGGPLSPDPSQRLNVHLYWLPPTEYGRTDVDGALRALGYKVKDADQDIDNRVVEQTRADGWELETSSNPFDSNIAFYRHVSSKAEIDDAIDTLVDHFSEFGDEYAVDSDE